MTCLAQSTTKYVLGYSKKKKKNFVIFDLKTLSHFGVLIFFSFFPLKSTKYKTVDQ